jgi:hypothetical protein
LTSKSGRSSWPRGRSPAGFGKLGANGQTTLKTFGSDAEAKAAYDS